MSIFVFILDTYGCTTFYFLLLFETLRPYPKLVPCQEKTIRDIQTSLEEKNHIELQEMEVKRKEVADGRHVRRILRKKGHLSHLVTGNFEDSIQNRRKK